MPTPGIAGGEKLKAVATAQRDIKPVPVSAQSANPPASQNLPFSEAFFTSLPGTAGEASALKVFLPAARVLTQAQATETALKQVSHPRLLHIATHGFFLEDKKKNVAGDSASDTQEDDAENPLLRSGLALAGANGIADDSDALPRLGQSLEAFGRSAAGPVVEPVANSRRRE